MGTSRLHKILAALLSGVLALALVAAISGLNGGDGLSRQVRASLAESGVKSEVTAVLLNFRGYDTLLEIAVLLLALIGVTALAGGEAAPEKAVARDPALSGLAELILPLMVLASGYLLYAGTYAPGGAFQAGAVLAAAILLARLAGIAEPERRKGALAGIAAIGFAAFLSAALVPLLLGARFFDYPGQAAHVIIIVIEAALTISTALILYLLFSECSSIRQWRGREGGAE